MQAYENAPSDTFFQPIYYGTMPIPLKIITISVFVGLFFAPLIANYSLLLQRKIDEWLFIRDFKETAEAEKEMIFSPEDCEFIRKHWQIDMSALQLARYFGCAESEIHHIRKFLGLKYNLGQLTAFATPYPLRIAVGVTKATHDVYGGANERVHGRWGWSLDC